jgi:hypothetical protein
MLSLPRVRPERVPGDGCLLKPHDASARGGQRRSSQRLARCWFGSSALGTKWLSSGISELESPAKSVHRLRISPATAVEKGGTPVYSKVGAPNLAGSLQGLRRDEALVVCNNGDEMASGGAGHRMRGGRGGWTAEFTRAATPPESVTPGPDRQRSGRAPPLRDIVEGLAAVMRWPNARCPPQVLGPRGLRESASRRTRREMVGQRDYPHCPA